MSVKDLVVPTGLMSSAHIVGACAERVGAGEAGAHVSLASSAVVSHEV